MKIITSIVALGFLIITTCLFWLLRSGVSIRTAPIIKPSVISGDLLNIPQGSFLRLFPDIQQAHYLIWNVDQNSAEVQKTLSAMKKQTEDNLRLPVNFIYDGAKASIDEVKECPRPCWVLFPPDQINELRPNEWISKKITPTEANYFTISWINFDRQVNVPESCTDEKRLDLECLKLVSVREVKKHIKEESKRYFFMRKYMDRDYFLFIEKIHTPQPTAKH